MNEKKPHYLMQFFKYDHLPDHLQEVSRPFCELAEDMDKFLDIETPEKSAAFRKLLESKDCAVRSVLFK